jgi:hypothetical protein
MDVEVARRTVVLPGRGIREGQIEVARGAGHVTVPAVE